MYTGKPEWLYRQVGGRAKGGRASANPTGLLPEGDANDAFEKGGARYKCGLTQRNFPDDGALPSYECGER